MNDVAKSERPKAPGAMNTRGAALLGGAGAVALLLGGLTVALAPSASADGIEQPKGNPTCADLIPGSKELKIDNPASGLNNKTDGPLSVNATVRNLLVDDPAHPGNQIGNEVFDFVALGGSVLGVIVKGGESANLYDYRPAGATVGTALHAPLNPKNEKFSDLSHMSFCFGTVTTPTPTPTPPPTPTPTPTPSTTPSGTPSQSPSMTPAASPSNSPSQSTTPVPVPTAVDAGLMGPTTSSKAAITSTQGIWGGVLLALGVILLIAGVLRSLKRRGSHTA